MHSRRQRKPQGSCTGTRHDHIREGLRTTGFERRLTIAFEVTTDQVMILGFVPGGRDWTAILGDGE